MTYDRDELHTLIDRAREIDRHAVLDLYDEYANNGMSVEEYMDGLKAIIGGSE